LLSRQRAGVPTGARGRLGGFLLRRNQTDPGREAGNRPEGPPERANPIRKKGTKNADGCACLDAGPLGKAAGPVVRRGGGSGRGLE
jgi:hypothetical protein